MPPRTTRIDIDELFKRDEPLATEFDIEVSTEMGQPVKDPLPVSLSSQHRRKMRGHINEIFGRPKWRQALVELGTTPFEDAANIGYNYFYSQFKRSGMDFEAEILVAIMSGLFGSTRKGHMISDFTTFDGDHSLGAKALDNAKIIQLPKRLKSHGEVFTDAFMEDSQNALGQMDEASANRFLKILYAKGEELGSIIKQRFPRLRAEGGQRILNDALGHRIGQVFQEAYQQNGIERNGDIFWGGEKYNILDTNSVADMINDITKDKYPLQEVAQKPGPKARNVTSQRSNNGRPLSTV